MKPATQDIEIYRGDAFSMFFRIRRKNADGTDGAYEDLTSWSGIAQIRATTDDSTKIADFVVTFSDQTLYPGGCLISLTAATTSTLTFTGTGNTKAIGVYDVQLTNTLGEPNTFLTGAVNLTKDVSRVP